MTMKTCGMALREVADLEDEARVEEQTYVTKMDCLADRSTPGPLRSECSRRVSKYRKLLSELSGPEKHEPIDSQVLLLGGMQGGVLLPCCRGLELRKCATS